MSASELYLILLCVVLFGGAVYVVVFNHKGGEE